MIRKRSRNPLNVANEKNLKHPTAGAWLTSPPCEFSTQEMPKEQSQNKKPWYHKRPPNLHPIIYSLLTSQHHQPSHPHPHSSAP